jgi:hypothetical protein
MYFGNPALLVLKLQTYKVIFNVVHTMWFSYLYLLLLYPYVFYHCHKYCI